MDSLASHALLGCYWLGLQVASAILRDSCAGGYGGEWWGHGHYVRMYVIIVSLPCFVTSVAWGLLVVALSVSIASRGVPCIHSFTFHTITEMLASLWLPRPLLDYLALLAFGCYFM